MTEEEMIELVRNNLAVLTNKNLTPVDIATVIVFNTFTALGKGDLISPYNAVIGNFIKEKMERGELPYELLFNGNGDLGSKF